MEAATERISNWSGYRLFQDALAQVGFEHLPTLKKVLPDLNGGLVTSEQSRTCLDELKFFEASYRGAAAWTLVDDERDLALVEYVRAYEGVFIMSGSTGLEVGIDERGLFVRRPARARLLRSLPPQEIFRAMRVVQRKFSIGDGAELEDADTGRRVTVPLCIEIDGECPQRMSVELRPRDATFFDYCVRPLRSVFVASVETDNPVRWC